MPGYLAGTASLAARPSRHAFSLTGREILIAVVVVAVFVFLLVAPVLWGAAFDSFSSNMNKAARPAFLFGFGVLIVGLASGIRIIDIAGGVVMAATLLGIIAEYYLTLALSRDAAARDYRRQPGHTVLAAPVAVR